MLLRLFTFIIALVLLEPQPSLSQDSKSEGQTDDSISFEGIKAGERRELIPNIFFRWCPAGTFTMGSPQLEPRRGADENEVLVTLTNGFWLGETEVTQGQWQKIMGTTPWDGKEYIRDGDDYPACFISHENATACCDKLTTEMRASSKLPVGWKISLPTEAQWEFACRAGTTTKFSFGASQFGSGDYAWLDRNTWEIGEKYPHMVGSKKPNAWGLDDMHGNVWEWCSDRYEDKLEGGRNPEGPSSGSYRVFRGGSWLSDGERCRSAQRGRLLPYYRDYYWGFRFAVVRF